nr:hypothetical protein [Streptomyces europaeiscabiei]
MGPGPQDAEPRTAPIGLLEGVAGRLRVGVVLHGEQHVLPLVARVIPAYDQERASRERRRPQAHRAERGTGRRAEAACPTTVSSAFALSRNRTGTAPPSAATVSTREILIPLSYARRRGGQDRCGCVAVRDRVPTRRAVPRRTTSAAARSNARTKTREPSTPTAV